MEGWFELNKGSEGQFYFRLKAANGETILSSEQYQAKGSAERGIASVQINSGLHWRYEKQQASNGRPYFTLKAANHQIIGTSQIFASEKTRDAGIESVRANGRATTIKDNT